MAELKVLIVDDDARVRQLVRRTLQAEFGAQLIEAADGLDALGILESEHVDVVIVDVHMPGMTGIETLEAIRRSAVHRDLPVLAISGAPDEPTVRRLAELRVASVLSKPLSPQLLCHRLREHCGLRVESPGLAAAPRWRPRASQPALIADADQPYAAWLASQVRALCPVLAFGSAVAALQRALAEPPQAVFLSSGDRFLAPDVFARKIERLPVRPLLFLIDAPDATGPVPREFVARVRRQRDPHGLLEDLGGVLEEASLAQLLLGPDSAGVQERVGAFAKAVEQGTATEVAVTGEMPPWVAEDDRTIEASAGLTVGSLRWSVHLLAVHECALQQAVHARGVSADALSEEHLHEWLAGEAEALCRSLHERCAAARVTVFVEPARAESTRRYGTLLRPLRASARTWWLTSPSGRCLAAVQLARESAGEPERL